MQQRTCRVTASASQPRWKGEEGIAMITAILTVVVVLSLGLVAIGLASHNTEATAQDRARAQAIHAAEGGANLLVSQIQESRPEELPCGPLTGSLNTSPSADYEVAVTYYSVHPPATGTELDCDSFTSSSDPKTALIRSMGTATGISPVKRGMELQIRLTPVIGGFSSAIFSDSAGGDLEFGNQMKVTGNSTFDGDIYTNGDWICSNQVTVEGSVYAQGVIDMSSSCTVKVDAWSNGSLTMANSALVREDAASSTATIDVTKSNNKPAIERNATAGTTCTGCDQDTVGGVIAENTPLDPPPQKDFPKVWYKPGEWFAEGYNIRPTYVNDCAGALAYIEGAFAGATQPQVVRITGDCELAFNQSNTIAVPHHLAIITDGAISVTQQTKFVGTGDQNVFFMVPYYTDPDIEDPVNEQPCSPDPRGDIFVGNQTRFIEVNISAYTPCEVEFRNNNAGNGGQIYGGSVKITNKFELKYVPILIPGSGEVTGYNIDTDFTREVIV